MQIVNMGTGLDLSGYESKNDGLYMLQRTH
jgi:hypothetical protein